VDPREIYETCDQCERLVIPWGAFFDGKQFLCHECRDKLSAHAAARQKETTDKH
jgi:hypothetical protein